MPAAEEPELEQSLMFFVQAFYVLSTERSASMGGVMPIPWSSVIMYADRYCVGEDQQDRLVMYIGAMDEVYCKHHNDKVKKELGKVNKPATARKPTLQRR